MIIHKYSIFTDAKAYIYIYVFKESILGTKTKAKVYKKYYLSSYKQSKFALNKPT